MSESHQSAKANLRRWVGWFLIATIFAIACALLSNWQFNRREEALQRMALVSKNYEAAAVSIDEVTEMNRFLVENEWRPVQLNGHYLIDKAVLVRNRPLNGQPGFLEVVPFQLTDGRVIAVERGWVAADDQLLAPKTYALPSDQEQTVKARVRAQESSLDRSAPPGQLATINIDALVTAEKITEPVFQDLYVRMFDESVAPAKQLKSLAKPQLDEGNHLSYALQWILFALMAFAALWWAIRQELNVRRGVVKARKKAAVGDRDKQAEDAMLDL